MESLLKKIETIKPNERQEFILKLDAKQIIELCQQSDKYKKLCEDTQFWIRKMQEDGYRLPSIEDMELFLDIFNPEAKDGKAKIIQYYFYERNSTVIYHLADYNTVKDLTCLQNIKLPLNSATRQVRNKLIELLNAFQDLHSKFQIASMVLWSLSIQKDILEHRRDNKPMEFQIPRIDELNTEKDSSLDIENLPKFEVEILLGASYANITDFYSYLNPDVESQMAILKSEEYSSDEDIIEKDRKEVEAREALKVYLDQYILEILDFAKEGDKLKIGNKNYHLTFENSRLVAISNTYRIF